MKDRVSCLQGSLRWQTGNWSNPNHPIMCNSHHRHRPAAGSSNLFDVRFENFSTFSSTLWGVSEQLNVPHLRFQASKTWDYRQLYRPKCKPIWQRHSLSRERREKTKAFFLDIGDDIQLICIDPATSSPVLLSGFTSLHRGPASNKKEWKESADYNG